MNHAGSSGPTYTNADAVLPDSLDDDDFYMDHPAGPSALSNDDGPLTHNSPMKILMKPMVSQFHVAQMSN